MRQISPKNLERKKLIHAAVDDYYGDGANEKEKDEMGKRIITRSFIKLDEIERLDALHIMANLSDKEYRQTLLKSILAK